MNQKILGLQNAILVVNPVPEGDAIPSDEMEDYINNALESSKIDNVTGSAITPYLLEKVSNLSRGKNYQSKFSAFKKQC